VKTVDLFCGAGGFSEGFRRAGFTCAYAVDFDAQAIDTFKFNHPTIAAEQRDVSEISGNSIRAFAGLKKGEVDVIIGGPPCQGFSLAGLRFTNDPKNRLVLEYIRIVKELCPSFFVFENVSGIVSMNHGAVLQVLQKEFRGLGYSITYGVLNAALYGVPQARPRFIIIGRMDSANVSLPEPTNDLGKDVQQNLLFGLPNALTVREALADLPEVLQGEGEEELKHLASATTAYQLQRRGGRNPGLVFNQRATRHSEMITTRYSMIPPGYTNAVLPAELRTKKINVFRLHPDYPSRTVTCNFRTDLLHPWLPRGLTVREAARLQSFDDDYRFFGNLTRKAKWVTQDDQVGNAVPPLLAEAIAKHVLFMARKP
jgi:DNA (cytosine-5)-methyltransferase 1